MEDNLITNDEIIKLDNQISILKDEKRLVSIEIDNLA